ncbi:hypothetical protein ES288_D03G172600v1 [Gossypium darwinii]|uniref:Uncharacterized protein n=1 Tax=Gossypium darwinii TaxID=34276 RepID=A0A5D2D5Q1_GOSDA|nr:hypothetical protein ES288_D03G172600v1 [Gossypium darwinii]
MLARPIYLFSLSVFTDGICKDYSFLLFANCSISASVVSLWILLSIWAFRFLAEALVLYDMTVTLFAIYICNTSTRIQIHLLCINSIETPIVCELKRMTVLKRYVLRLFVSLKYITANVVDRNNGRIVATASTVEHSIKNSLECGRSCNAKAATVVGEVLAMRLKVEGLEQGQGRGIHVDVNKEVEKKSFKNRTKVWAVVNALKNHGVKVVLEDIEDNPSRPSF